MTSAKKSAPDKKNVTTIRGDVVDSVIVTGDNNTTFFQKIINYIFPSEKETLEQRNRRILLGHVENAWIKGVLDASLYGAAMLDLGIKETPEAITNKYPWTLKKESTDETLPAGTSMLEIFDSIGMGRSLLILGAPGSGKTTMLLELARGLIARAREDVTQPIPMVFNLASWTEKLTLTDWLAQELNNLYSVPRKTAPDWVKGNKLLLLLDGLDEVRQESRAKCVEAINEFRKQNGLTSLAVCSRSQDYADLNAKLSFEGAIEVQPLTQGQIAEFFNRFGDEIAGIKQAIEKDSELREMAETPLFLSIMLMAYKDKRDVEILTSRDEKIARRKHLFDTYIERMFERRTGKKAFKKQNILYWLSWLANKMNEHNQVPLFIESIQPVWLGQKRQLNNYRWFIKLFFGLTGGIIGWLGGGPFGNYVFGQLIDPSLRLIVMLIGGVVIGLLIGQVLVVLALDYSKEAINTVDKLSWDIKNPIAIGRYIGWAMVIVGLFTGVILGLSSGKFIVGMRSGLFLGMAIGVVGLMAGLISGLEPKQIDNTTHPGERLSLTAKNSIFVVVLSVLLFGLICSLTGGLLFGIGVQKDWLIAGLIEGLYFGLPLGLLFGVVSGLALGGFALIQHYSLRFLLSNNNLLPWRLIPFLDHCVDLIFLRRVGGGYIFIHRLLMEHFADMYVESPTSKETKNHGKR